MSNINESNLDHDNRSYAIPNEHTSVLGGGHISGNNMTTKLSRLSNKENKSSAEESAYQWLKHKNNEEINQIDAKKRIVMDTEGVGKKKGGNVYKDTYSEDGIPSGVAIPSSL